MQVDGVLIDLSKAFDRVPHGRLIKTLIYLGAPSCLARWVNAHLSNRRKFVDVNGTFSGLLDVYSGVPQDSVLGPLPFLVYVNSLFQSTTDGPIKLRMFADDCVVYTPVSIIQDQIKVRDVLASIASWFHENNMKINISKTQYIYI